MDVKVRTTNPLKKLVFGYDYDSFSYMTTSDIVSFEPDTEIFAKYWYIHLGMVHILLGTTKTVKLTKPVLTTIKGGKQ